MIERVLALPAVVWVRRVLEEYGKDNGGTYAQAMAYSTIFAIAPLLLLAVSVAGFVLGQQSASAAVTSAVERAFGPSVASTVQSFLGGAVRRRYASGVLGLALAAWSGSVLVLQARGTMNTIFGRPPDAPGGIWGWLWQRGAGVLGSFGLAVAVAAIAALNVWVGGAADRLPGRAGVAVGLAGYVLVFALVAVVAAVALQMLSIRRLTWRSAAAGGVTVAVGDGAAAAILGIYLARANFDAFGAAAGIVVVLFVAYALAQVFVLGAEVAKVVEAETPPPGSGVAGATGLERHQGTRSPQNAGSSVVIAFVVGWMIGRFKRR